MKRSALFLPFLLFATATYSDSHSAVEAKLEAVGAKIKRVSE